VVDFVLEEADVVATARVADGSQEQVRGKYLVGCDGGASTVRKKLGNQA
jgi:2-polyprenyl-6-methoxyphenol hydroxylase-like FAD-dependent oxidoreductase